MRKNMKFGVCGALAGLVNGAFGAGGGMVLVPLFKRLCNLPEKIAFATSVSVILPMSAVSALIYLWRADVDFFAALPFLVGGAVGGLLGGKIFQNIPTLWLKRMFALFLLYGGVRSLFF